MDITSSSDIYERTILENEAGTVQIRLTISEFREVEYLHLRRYYLDFDGDWHPSGEGLAMILDFDIVRELFIGLSEIMSLAESREIIEEYFSDVIKSIYRK